METGSKFKQKISDSEKEEKKKFKSLYDGLSKSQILKRMCFGGEEEVKIETPLEAWMRIYSMTKEELLAKYPDKFNSDGSFKGGE
jgi:hypothetical protein